MSQHYNIIYQYDIIQYNEAAAVHYSGTVKLHYIIYAGLDEAFIVPASVVGMYASLHVHTKLSWLKTDSVAPSVLTIS